MRALREYEVSLSSSQGRKQSELGTIKFSDALQTLSSIGPSVAEGLNNCWKEARKKAKAVGFGYLFGMGYKKFKIYARDNYDIIISDREAQESRDLFFDTYTFLADWHKDQKRFAAEHGYVVSLSGRKRRLPDAMLREDTPARAEAQRQAINSPVQSFANEINLMSALQLRKEFPRSVLRICATVHDAILMRVRNDMVPTVYKRTLKIMQRPDLFEDFDIRLKVPIEADAKIGAWSQGVKLEKWLKV
jgi:DNA polymerase-1